MCYILNTVCDLIDIVTETAFTLALRLIGAERSGFGKWKYKGK